MTRPTLETDPADCAWCWQDALGIGGPQCPYHGELGVLLDRDAQDVHYGDGERHAHGDALLEP